MFYFFTKKSTNKKEIIDNIFKKQGPTNNATLILYQSKIKCGSHLYCAPSRTSLLYEPDVRVVTNESAVYL